MNKNGSDIPIHRGSLLIPDIDKISIKESWQQKYCVLYKMSKFGTERIEIYDNTNLFNQTPFKTILLQDFIKIIPRDSTQFAIMTKEGIYEFGTITASSTNEWLQALQLVVFPDNYSKITSIEEDNDLYCPSGEGIFNVKLHASPASLRCGLKAKPYVLVLSSNDAQLRNCDDNELLFTWPYCFIRRYGYKNGKFTFEAGRKCASGEGIFFLEYHDLQTIFRCFASKIKYMKKFLSNEAISGIDHSLNVDARSRSTLPPLISSSMFLNDTTQSLSYKPQKISVSMTTKSKSIMSHTPIKPPRKFVHIKLEDSKLLLENVNKYEEIECRNDAWRTKGINEVNHIESEFPEPEEYMSWGQVKKTQNVIPQMFHAPKVINEPLNAEEYDKLNFFGASSKLDNSSTYKQVNITSKDSLLSNPPSFNMYDEVEPINAYMINTHISLNREGSYIDHQFHNNEPYALISKQKKSQ